MARSIVAAWTTTPRSASSTSTSTRSRWPASTRTSRTSRFSPYEFTLTFARIDHEIEEGDVPGVVTSRVEHVGAVLPGAARGDAGLLLEVVDAGRDSQPSRSAAALRLDR